MEYEHDEQDYSNDYDYHCDEYSRFLGFSNDSERDDWLETEQ